MALCFCVLFCCFAELSSEQRCSQDRETHLNRNNHQSNNGELPAVNTHHTDVDHGECSVQNGGEGLAGQEISDLFQFPHTGR